MQWVFSFYFLVVLNEFSVNFIKSEILCFMAKPPAIQIGLIPCSKRNLGRTPVN